MASYIDIGNKAFSDIVNDEYVDKTGLIAEINSTLFKEKRFSCVTRCRRFGKSMAAKMLCAYYDRSCDSRELFRGLRAEQNPDFEKHLNKYPVIYVDMTEFTTRYRKDPEIVSILQRTLMKDISAVCPDITIEEDDDLMEYLLRVATTRDEEFIVIIDEWDAICREFQSGSEAMDDYVNLLRRMFKSASAARVFAGVYMTGILPIKRYRTQSALNNFQEYTMIRPRGLESFFGFTKEEVRALCEKHGMDFEEMAKWYDGYSIGKEPSMFNPNSVMRAIEEGECESNWATTGSFDIMADYIQMDFEGLQGDMVKMLAGGSCPVSTSGFQNDPGDIRSKDDVLTVLIHLGYLAYNKADKTCFVPNKEVREELENAIRNNGWKNVMDALNASDRLLRDLLDGEAEYVAAGIEKAHEDNASILEYNDENSLSCVIGIAFYAARKYYKVFREFPTGRGFADLVLIPWHNVSKPAIVIELKWKMDANTAISQIHDRHYPDSLKDYSGEIILCGVSYDKQTKEHKCVIEKI